MPSLPASRARNACGVWRRIPAPSPVSFSAPVAPRCSRLSNTSSAFVTIWCEGRPLTSATNPKPQESCSRAGSYSPCLGGGPASAIAPALPEKGSSKVDAADENPTLHQKGSSLLRRVSNGVARAHEARVRLRQDVATEVALE